MRRKPVEIEIKYAIARVRPSNPSTILGLLNVVENATDSATPAEAESDSEPKGEGRLSFSEVFRGKATERAKAVPRAAILGNVFHWFIVVAIVAGIINGIFDLGGGEAEAKLMAETFVRKQLKSPSTADFPSTNEYTATEIEDDVWRVSGYVDAQNSFGATIRTRWTVAIPLIRQTV